MNKSKDVKKCVNFLRTALLAVPHGDAGKGVVDAFQVASESFTPATLSDAFWELDNRPGMYSDRDSWHPKLRQCRNNPKYGEQMFSFFN